MAALALIPATLDLVAVSEDELDDENESALFQGQTHTLLIDFVDAFGDPFDLGPTNTPRWAFACQLRSDFFDSDASADATYASLVEDGPNGRVVFTLTPTQTAALIAPDGTWDLFLTNVSDPDYAVGFAQMTHRGVWKRVQRTTSA